MRRRACYLGDMASYSRRQTLVLGAGLTATVFAPPVFAQSADNGAMIKKPIPHSGEMLPVVGLGTANSFGRAERDDTRKVIEALVAGGGSLIDTASTYGAAEEVIGEALAGANLRDRVFLATKKEAENGREGKAEFDASLRKLRVKQVDLMMLHNVRDSHQSLAYLRDWKAQKLARYVGISSTFPRDFPAVEAVVKREKPDFVELNYSIGDREIEQRLLPACADAGSAVLTALPFGRSSVFRAVHGKQLPDWASEFDAASWGQFFLKFLLGHKAVTAVIPGTTKRGHMDDNLAAGRGRLPDETQRKKMAAFFASLN
jgi:aryl-alcohol dehydrogenase-like predicted oxidoreductase